MAIIRLPSSSGAQLDLSFNNGDFVAIQETAQRLGFVDEERMIRYLLAVISKSATRSVTITDQNGAKINLSPADDLLKQDK